MCRSAHCGIDLLVGEWDLCIRSVESPAAYSGLVDLAVQRERFEAQARLAAAAGDETMPLGGDFLRAMEYRMPPSGGMGMRIGQLRRDAHWFGYAGDHPLPVRDPNELIGGGSIAQSDG